jgi:hypothetical protein
VKNNPVRLVPKARWKKNAAGDYELRASDGLLIAGVSKYPQWKDPWLAEVLGCDLGNYGSVRSAKSVVRRHIARLQGIEFGKSK